MTRNVVQTVLAALKPEVSAAAAERLGEQPAGVATALSAAIPGVFRLLSLRGAEPNGPEVLLAAMKASRAALSLNDPLGRLPEKGAAGETVLGEDGPALGRRVADFAGLDEGSGAALVSMVVPLALGALARTAPPPLNAETLARTLREQENNVDRAFPPGFTLGGPETSTIVAATSPKPAEAGPVPPMPAEHFEPSRSTPISMAAPIAAPTPAPPARPPVEQYPREDVGSAHRAGLPRWLLPLLAGLILLAVAFFLMRSLGGDDARGPAPAPAEGGSQAAAPQPRTE